MDPTCAMCGDPTRGPDQPICDTCRHVTDDDPPRLRDIADVCWQRYASTCVLGGTDQQRQWAYDLASKAEEKARQAGRIAREHRLTAGVAA